MSRLDVLYDNESILAKGVTAVERPRIPTPKLRTNSIVIPGRHGSLAEVDAYDDILIPIKYYILNAEIKPLIRTIKGFLQNKRFLQFSDDDIFYKIKKINILK